VLHGHVELAFIMIGGNLKFDYIFCRMIGVWSNEAGMHRFWENHLINLKVLWKQSESLGRIPKLMISNCLLLPLLMKMRRQLDLFLMEMQW